MRAKQYLLVLLLAFAGRQLAWADSQPIAEPSTLDLTILHDNDLHGHLFPFPYVERERMPRENPSRGGAARRATLIHRLKDKIHNPVLLIDSGDTTTRGPLATTYEGLADIDAMNAVGYDLAAIGNNEFKLKDAAEENDAPGAQAALLRLVKRSRFPWICANATNGKGDFLEGIQPYIVRRVGGVRVGFLGLTAPRSASYPQTRGWTISDPIAAAREWIPRARADCDILIAVTHIGTPMDMALAGQTRGLDAIVGGDSHTYLYKAIEASNLSGEKVPIVQDGEFGVDLGRFDLHFARGADGHWALARYEYQLLPVDPSLPADREVQQVLAPYFDPMNVTVGQIPNAGATPAERDRITTRLVIDAIRKSTGADLALNTSGSGFFETFRRPIITRYDVFQVLPFEDHAVVATLTGKEVRALVASHPNTEISSPETVPQSGETRGPRFVDPMAGVQDDHSYRVAFVDYEATSTYHLAAERLTDSGIDVRKAVIDWLRQQSKSR